MALSAAKVRTVQRPQLVIRRSVVVDTGETLYQGAIVTLSATGAEAAVTTNPCIGISTDTYTTGQTAILEFNHIELLPIDSTPTVSDIGSTVYAVDSGEVTLTSTSNSAVVGYISDLGDSGDFVYVHVTTRA